MEEKQLWSEVNKIVKRCERRRKRVEGSARARVDKRENPAGMGAGDPSPREERPRRSNSARQKKYDVFMRAVEEIMQRESDVTMDITLKGDMARAFHITMAIGKYLWNKDEDAMVQHIMQAGVEHIINEYNSDVVLKEAKKVFKPLLRELLHELEDEEL